jgi:glutamate-1-semialdehyde 2,1-aminomutase
LDKKAFQSLEWRLVGPHRAGRVVAVAGHPTEQQSLLGDEPDLTTIAKIIGGGFPVGAVTGRADFMDFFSPTKKGAKVARAGTFNGNPVTMIAGLTAM